MQQLIECVPNFSEGRRPAVVEQIVAAITAVPGIILLDRHMDADHNRSVVTFAGDAAGVVEAAFRGCARAAALIDLDTHRGAHPRIGATDVVPFIPIRDATTADCVALARSLGERVGRELDIPVYLYEEAATRESNRNLANVRRGEYEGLRRAIKADPARVPDFGPRHLGGAGAVAIGARFPLIAFNVNLAGGDVPVARAIARHVRASSGGLPFVKALGLALPGRGLVQVSMNLTDYTRTSLFRAFDAVEREAARHGVAIVASELVGLVPAAALLDATMSTPAGNTAELLPDKALLDAVARRLRLPGLPGQQVLELRLADALQGVSLTQPPLAGAFLAALPTASALPPAADPFLGALGAATAAPAGGSAAAYAGAMAASLVMMVAGLTLSKKSYAARHDAMRAMHAEAAVLQSKLRAAVSADALAYSAVMEAYKLPRNSAERAPAIERAMRGAAIASLQVAEQAARVLALARLVRADGLKTARSDSTVAAYLAEASARGALLNAKENVSTLTDDSAVRDFRARIKVVEEELRA